MSGGGKQRGDILEGEESRDWKYAGGKVGQI